MAQAQPIDQQDHEQYLKQRYGYSRIPTTSNRDRDKPAANENRRSKKASTQFISQDPDYIRKTPVPANINRRPKRFKARTKVTKALHPATLVKRIIVWAINLFFFSWQFILGIIFIVSFGGAAAITDFFDPILDLFGLNPRYLFLVPWLFIWFWGWLNMGIVWMFFFASGSHSLSGEFEGDKNLRFVVALTLYAMPIPVLNMLPWVFLWSGFVLKNPK